MGIISAIAHGALKTKSRLRSMTETFCCSKVYLYHEPVKGSYKITDMVPEIFFESVRHDLTCYYSASLWAEVVLRSMAGGESDGRVYDLLKCSMVALEGAAEKEVPLLSVQFLWRFLTLAGFGSDPTTCAKCGRQMEEEESAYLDNHPPAFICQNCSPVRNLHLTAGARRYLMRTTRLSIREASRYSLDRESLAKLADLLYELIQAVVETKLNSLAYVRGTL
jgi:DNA repair protein RecO (recombination protein O)